MARGYASVLVPLSPGEHFIETTAFVPLASSLFNDWASWLMGTPPEVIVFKSCLNRTDISVFLFVVLRPQICVPGRRKGGY